MADLTPTPIRVLVVDDDPLVRSALRMILDGADGITTVGEAPDGHHALTAAAEHRPHVVLMDIRMPGLDGITATTTLLTHPNPPHVIVLTTFDADHDVLRALHAGAAGFLLKHTPPAQLVDAIRTVAAGDAILSPQVTRNVLAHVRTTTHPSADDPTAQARARLAVLSDREQEVAHAIGAGLSNAEISQQLFMSVATVKAHVSRMLTKLDLNNRVQIALLAYEARPR